MWYDAYIKKHTLLRELGTGCASLRVLDLSSNLHKQGSCEDAWPRILFHQTGIRERHSDETGDSRIVSPRCVATSQCPIACGKIVPTAEPASRSAVCFRNSTIYSRGRNISGMEPDLQAQRLKLRSSFQCLKSSHAPRLNTFKLLFFILSLHIESSINGEVRVSFVYFLY
jgi:hypothetical protein